MGTARSSITRCTCTAAAWGIPAFTITKTFRSQSYVSGDRRPGPAPSDESSWQRSRKGSADREDQYVPCFAVFKLPSENEGHSRWGRLAPRSLGVLVRQRHGESQPSRSRKPSDLNRTYPEIGVRDPHHPTSHHGNDPVKVAQIAKINTYHVSLFSNFLQKMKATPDGDGSLLDHSVYLYGSGMGNPSLHDHENLPISIVRIRRSASGTRTIRRVIMATIP